MDELASFSASCVVVCLESGDRGPVAAEDPLWLFLGTLLVLGLTLNSEIF